MRFGRKILLIYLLLVVVSPLHAKSLFEGDSLLEIELTGPLGSLIENKNEPDEWPAKLRLEAHELDVLLRARGNSRKRICDFPPLRLNFKTSDIAGTLFEGQDKLKLVTLCRKNDTPGINVLEEYAAYRIFGLLSEVSYRVRLVHITYSDTDKQVKEKYRETFGFLIEPSDQLAGRVHGSVSEIPGVAAGQLDKNQAALVYVFEYLIGNTDWSFVASTGDENCCHNIELIAIGTKQFPVPYDFDLSGVVNATYARPDPSLKIDKVWQRLYLGYCTEPELLHTALDTITAMEDEVRQVIADLPGLTGKEKKKRMDYLEGFFKKAENKDRLIRSFERHCKG